MSPASSPAFGDAALETPTTQQDALIDAALRRFLRFGLERTSMADVASEAGLHRATLYRHFRDRNELVSAVLLRQSRPIMERTRARLDSSDDTAESLVDALVHAFDEVLRDEQLRVLFTSGTVASTQSAAVSSSEFMSAVVSTALPALERAKSSGQLRPDIDPEDALRWLMRIAISLVGSEPTLDNDETARLLETYVIPAIFRSPSHLNF